MHMNQPMRRLRMYLAFSAIMWGVSLVGVVLPWPKAVLILQQLGAGEIHADPMLDYWLRMASGAFGLVGGLFLVFALQPARYVSVIPLFGWLMISEGVILLIHGLRLHLPPLPFYADTAACFLAGVGILKSASEARKSPSSN